MVKSRMLYPVNSKQEIDFSKKQLLVMKNNSNEDRFIVLCSGQSNDCSFCGMIVWVTDDACIYKVGEYSDEWTKEGFKIFNNAIELSN